MEKTTMVNSVIPIASAVGGVVTYVALGFIVPDISIFSEIGGGLTVGGLLFFILRWALKRNDSLTDKLHQMHEDRAQTAERHFNEIKEILKNKT